GRLSGRSNHALASPSRAVLPRRDSQRQYVPTPWWPFGAIWFRPAEPETLPPAGLEPSLTAGKVRCKPPSISLPERRCSFAPMKVYNMVRPQILAQHYRYDSSSLAARFNTSASTEICWL